MFPAHSLTRGRVKRGAYDQLTANHQNFHTYWTNQISLDLGFRQDSPFVIGDVLLPIIGADFWHTTCRDKRDLSNGRLIDCKTKPTLIILTW